MQTRIDKRIEKSRRAFLFTALTALVAALLALAGCGGGGGGGGTGGGNTATVTGTVLRAETGVPPSPGATVTIGGQSATTAADGTFTLSNVPVSTTTGTVSATGVQIRTLTLSLVANQTNNLGQIYISDTGYNATVTGRVVTIISGQAQPVGGAKVTLAGSQTTTATDGTFTLNNLPVGLGSTNGTFGTITATGFLDKPITADVLKFPLVAGSNPLGDLVIAKPSGTTPPPPFTITGAVKVKGTLTQGLPVTIKSNGTSLGIAMTDGNGNYFFWVVPGTYTLSVTDGTTSGQTTVTLNTLDTPVTATTINLSQ